MQGKKANFNFDYETGTVKRNGRKYGLIKHVEDDAIYVLVTQKGARAWGETMKFIVVIPEDSKSDDKGND